MTPHICVLIGIREHPRYVYRPRFFVIAGAIIEAAAWGRKR